MAAVALGSSRSFRQAIIVSWPLGFFAFVRASFPFFLLSFGFFRFFRHLSFPFVVSFSIVYLVSFFSFSLFFSDFFFRNYSEFFHFVVPFMSVFYLFHRLFERVWFYFIFLVISAALPFTLGRSSPALSIGFALALRAPNAR